MEIASSGSHKWISIISGIFILVGLYLTTLYNYLFFHSIAEVFIIVVACGIFVLAWNSRKVLDNNYLLFIGIAYLFIAILELIHTLGYAGMGIFKGYDTNLPTQLWIAARYMESISLLIAPLFFGRRIRLNMLVVVYASVACLIFLSIFFWDIFPVCFVEGTGLTLFKKISEYIICFIFTGSIALLYQKRKEFEAGIYRLLIASIVLSIAAELTFTFYIHAYGFSNLVGHYFTIISFYLIYKAIIETGLVRPYDLLFRNLKQSEEALRESESRYSILSNATFEGILIHKKGIVIDLNNRFAEMFGYEPDQLIGADATELIPPEYRDTVKNNIASGHEGPYEVTGLKKDSSTFHMEIRARHMRYKGRDVRTAVVRDISDLKQAESSLRDSRNMLQIVLDSIPSAVFWKDRDSIYLGGNRTWLEAVGLKSSEDVVGKSDYDFPWEKEQADKFREDDRRIMEAGIPEYDIIEPFVRSDGIQAWARTNKVPLRDKEGNIAGILGTYEDITEQIQVKEALRESEERFRTAFENAATGIALMANDGYFMNVNQALCKLLGYSEEELLSKTWVEITEPDDLPGCYDWLKRIKAGEQSAHEKRFIHKLGHPVWIMVSSSLVRDSQGRIRYYISLFQNITLRKEAEEALQKSEEKYRSLVKNITSAVYKGYKDWSVEFFDEKIELFTGYDVNEFNSKKMKWSDIIVKEDIETAREIFIKALKTDKSYVREYRIKSKAGDIHWIEERGYIVCGNNGEIEYVNGIFFDKTETKKLEAQLQQSQKMESIGTLAGGTAHEFNNILTTIIGNTELALNDVPESNPARECLEEIQTASLRAKDTVRQLLGFARKSVFQLMPVQISPIIRETLKLIRASIPTTIEIRQNLSFESDTVMADSTQISQILINLCANAKNAMQEKGGVLEVKLENTTLDEKSATHYEDLSPGNYLKLTVKDCGYGIDPKIIDRIFEPYFTTGSLAEATGMGLAVVHGIVKHHNGAIIVASEAGKGTVFEVLFPLIEAEAEQEAGEPEALPTGAERILFIDDEESLVKMAKRRLEMQGYRVETKTNPIEALELFRSAPDRFDLIITDMTMPKMTGDRLAKEILSIRPDMPIILCSGFSEKIDAEKAKELGIREYIEKPLDMSDFVVSIRKVLDEAKA